MKKNKEDVSERQHEMVTKTDGEGRTFVVCVNCGSIFVGGGKIQKYEVVL